MKIPLCVTLGLLLPSLSPANPPAVPQQTNLRIQTYSVEQGLSQSSAWCLFQDKQGFLWIGTADGLNRYDGYSFKIFRHDPGDQTSISNNTVWALCQDARGTFWVGTVAGVHRFDPLTRKFERLADKPKFRGTSLADVTRGILEDHLGLFWFASAKGIALFNPSNDSLMEFSPTELPPPTGVPTYRVLHEDEQGDVWVANGEHLYRYERSSGKFHRIPIGDNDQELMVLKSTRDRSGVYWFATLLGVWSFDPGTHQWRTYRHNPNDPSSLPDDRLRAIMADDAGRIWAGTIFAGLCYLDPTTGAFHSVKPTGEGMKNARYEGVSSILRDRSGLMWVGYDGAGLAKINATPSKFRHFLLPPSGASASGDNFFKSLIVDRRGDIWLGMYDQGLSVLNRETGRVTRYMRNPANPEGIGSNVVMSLLETQRGTILVGTDAGLDELDSRSGRFVHLDLGGLAVGPPGTVFNALYEDPAGTVWGATARYLLRFDRPGGRAVKVLSSPEIFNLPVSPSFTTITPAGDGTLWVGTLGGGLLRVQPDGTIEQRLQHNKDDKNTISHNAVKTILIDPEGVLWIGTEEGLNRYDPVLNLWRTYLNTDGLPNSFIYGLLMDEHRRLWISTNKGISRMDTGDPESPRFRNYTPDDGLQSYEFNTNVYFKTPEGEMFFGGINGFNAFFPDSVNDNQLVPSAVLTGFKKFDIPFDLEVDISGLETVALLPGESVFSFEFATLEFTNPGRNLYAYKMEGFDKDWIESGTHREARYTNLDPGEYLFRVKGSNSDCVWDESGTSISVIIVPPFWKTGWFIGVMSLVLAGAFGGTVRYMSTRNLRKQIAHMEREREIQEERQKTRERIARDLHDDLASTVGSAGLFVESVKRHIGDAPSQAREFLEKTSSLLTEAEQSMSDIVWSVSPQHDTVESLMVRIRMMTADVSRAAGKRFETETACDDPGCILRGDVRRNFYLVFKEALSNAARHSGAEMIRVHAHLKDGFLELSIADDGMGLDGRENKSSRSGHGLQNMKKRAADIGAELTVKAAPGGGTVVTLSKRMTPTGH